MRLVRAICESNELLNHKFLCRPQCCCCQLFIRLFFLILFLTTFNLCSCKSSASSAASSSSFETRSYNIPDPECTGSFGLCTQEDKDRLGYLSIQKLHAKMDDDQDGHVELQETKEFMKEELLYKGSSYSERENKFHNNDLQISVDEMWKSWQYSAVYNWTTEDIIVWLNEQVKLPQYADNFRRNKIDGQFMPRLTLNENNYYANIMQIKDPRHRRLLMIKSTDLVLFGHLNKPHNLIKDVLMISALTMSIFVCIYLFSKHRQSLDQIKRMMIEFDKLTTDENIAVPSKALLREAKFNMFNWRGNDVKQSSPIRSNSLFNFRRKKSTSLNVDHQKENVLSEKNFRLAKELQLAKIGTENLNNAGEQQQLLQLKYAEQELENVREALRQTELRLEMVKFQPTIALIHLLNRTYESEKELLDFKFKLIQKEKDACLETLNKVSRRQSGILGALKIAHSSTLEEINHKLEILKREIEKCKSERSEWIKRWNSIDEICNRVDHPHTSSIENGSQDLR